MATEAAAEQLRAGRRDGRRRRAQQQLEQRVHAALRLQRLEHRAAVRLGKLQQQPERLRLRRLLGGRRAEGQRVRQKRRRTWFGS